MARPLRRNRLTTFSSCSFPDLFARAMTSPMRARDATKMPMDSPNTINPIKVLTARLIQFNHFSSSTTAMINAQTKTMTLSATLHRMKIRFVALISDFFFFEVDVQ